MPYKPDPGDPQSPTPKTRAGLWDLTFRHMGCAGIGYWYLDGINALAGTPLQTLYISPARMTPDLDDSGRLIGWWLDYRRQHASRPSTSRWTRSSPSRWSPPTMASCPVGPGRYRARQGRAGPHRGPPRRIARSRPVAADPASTGPRGRRDAR